MFLQAVECFSQIPVNIIVTNTQAEQILLGNYNPQNFQPASVINSQEGIICGINNELSTDSLRSYLKDLGTFHNRNSGSDTLSADTGIGAARRWAYSKFQQFSAAHENRLVTSYLQFDQSICGMLVHRDIFAVLPGADSVQKSVIIIEAHIDSRCEGLCDIACKAQGIEDNGSGTALVLELARVMSKYSFNHSIVFLLTIAEEQGLYGANAFAQYVQDHGISVKAVQNNDIVGGIICGKTSSPPGCPYENHIDSVDVRIFSIGSFNQMHRSFARSIKLFYNEKFLSLAQPPMTVHVMNQEDRTGRGGDHQPFRQRGYTAVRFCAANEHGDANVTDTAYSDRQHTSGDVLGVDTDFDGTIDSFFVDMSYLKRNIMLNALSATMAAIGPETPDIQLINDTAGLAVQIIFQTQYPEYRVGVRPSDSLTDFETVYGFKNALYYKIPGIVAGKSYFISAASVDSNGITSIFSKEYLAANASVNTPYAPADPLNYSITCPVTGIDELQAEPRNGYFGIELMPCIPDPFDESTAISVVVSGKPTYQSAAIVITDINGREIKRIDMELKPGMNRVFYRHRSHPSGVFIYRLVVDGVTLQARKMFFLK